MAPGCAAQDFCLAPVRASTSSTVPSLAPSARIWPSVETATAEKPLAFVASTSLEVEAESRWSQRHSKPRQSGSPDRSEDSQASSLCRTLPSIPA
jgi:hypothetical protein